jgi:hypothetical protein
MLERVARLEAEVAAVSRCVAGVERAQDEILRSAWRIVFYLLTGLLSAVGAMAGKKLGLF